MLRFRLGAIAVLSILGACSIATYAPETSESAQDRIVPSSERHPTPAVLADALAALQDGNYIAAEPLFAQALRESPTDPYSHLGMGAVMEQTGRLFAAARHYRSAAAYGEDAGVASAFALDGTTPASAESSVADIARLNLNRLGV